MARKIRRVTGVVDRGLVEGLATSNVSDVIGPIPSPTSLAIEDAPFDRTLPSGVREYRRGPGAHLRLEVPVVRRPGVFVYGVVEEPVTGDDEVWSWQQLDHVWRVVRRIPRTAALLAEREAVRRRRDYKDRAGRSRSRLAILSNVPWSNPSLVGTFSLAAHHPTLLPDSLLLAKALIERR